MFVLSNFLIALARVIGMVLQIYSWLIVARALVSWVSPDPYNPIVQFLHRTTEPVLAPIRRLLPMMAVDVSPIIAFLIIMFLRAFLVQTLLDIGFAIR